ncbi:hypothetical protein BC830DRAFT_635455 [Chytriomyces sp. MP71]|nr:hypothetical protein BC830DRAFT_635455 [Chytriomyces sp. MP71]
MEMPVFGPGYVSTSNLQPNEKDTGKPLAGMKASASNHDLKEPFLPKLAGAGSKAHLRQATWSHSQVSMSATSLLSKGNKMIPNPKAIRTLEPLQNTPKPIGDSVFQSNGKNTNSTGEDYSKPDAYENINGEVTDIIKGRIEIKQDGPSSMNYGTSNLNGDESTNLTHGLQPFQDASAPDKQRKPQVKSLPPLPIKTNGDDAIPDTESDQTLSLKQAEEEALIANKKLHFQGSSHARFTVVPRTLDPSGPDPIQMAQNLLAASTAQVMSTAGSQFMLTSTPKVTLSGAPQYVRTSQSPALHHNPPAHYVSGNEERSNASMKNVEAAQISDHGYSDTNENQKKTKQKTKQDDSTDEQQICVDVSSFGSKGTLKMESEKTHEASTPSTSSSNLARHQITSSRQTVPKPKTPNLPRQLTHQKISFVSHAETDLSFQKNEQAASPSHSELNINMKKAVCLEESRENPIISEEVTLFQKPKDDLKPVDFLGKQLSNPPHKYLR